MQENELIDLTDIFDQFFKSVKKLWKVCLVIILLGTILLEAKTYFSYYPTYTSSMTVIVSKQSKNILVYSDASEEMNQSFQRALLSSSMQKIIAQDLGVNTVPASINVSLVPDTNFLLVQATSSNPEDAYHVVKSIETHYGQLTKLMNEANMILVEEAHLPTSPNTPPQYMKQAIKGIAIGCFISIVYLAIYTLTRRTIFKEQHIKEKLHLKNLGSIPEIAMKKRSYHSKDQLLITNPRIPTSFKESFRSLVISLQRKEDKKVFMFTSTNPNEGKSTISANVALMLAKENKKVVAIDLDLRNPSLSQVFNLPQSREEIGSYLDGRCSLRDIITPSELDDHLDLVLGYSSYTNSIEMLSREKFSILMEELKRRYDYVIVDVPPLLVMQDALSVAKECDSTVLVVKQDYAKVYEIMDALDELSGMNGHIMGCVLNVVKKSIFDEDSRGYHYGYGYGKS